MPIRNDTSKPNNRLESCSYFWFQLVKVTEASTPNLMPSDLRIDRWPVTLSFP